MDDKQLIEGADWEFNRTQLSKEEVPDFMIEPAYCKECSKPYEQEDMRSGICQACENPVKAYTKKELSKYRTALWRLFKTPTGKLDEYTSLTHNKKYNILQEIKSVDNRINK